ncbi:MAG: DNA adenine methylase [Caldilineaceae bacterium]|nr:DNA adenine methylase [Caldilineaceae bacterium]
MTEKEKTAVPVETGIGAKPFLKWAGGKSQLLPQFEAHYPQELLDGSIHRYIEPFLGGGALFLAIAQRYAIKEAYLTDINPELILVYRVVQQDVPDLIAQLDEYQKKYDAGSEDERAIYFYAVREQYNAQRAAINFERYSSEWVTRAARMIFLNKTCFNGLFRVNAKGGFNVPFGRYKNPAICDPENLRRVSAHLQNAELQVAPFKSCEQWVNKETFIYFDPPYRPISTTSSFTSYSSDKFDDVAQIALAEFFAHLHREYGAKLMLSNSDPSPLNPTDDFFQQHYDGFNVHRVWASRMINSQADKRGKITELLITSY